MYFGSLLNKKIERRRNAVLTKTEVFMILRLLYVRCKELSMISEEKGVAIVYNYRLCCLKKSVDNFTGKLIIAFD